MVTQHVNLPAKTISLLPEGIIWLPEPAGKFLLLVP